MNRKRAGLFAVGIAMATLGLAALGIYAAFEFLNSTVAALPGRADRMDDMARFQPVALGGLCGPGGTAAQCTSFCQKRGICGAVNGAIAVQQGVVRRIDDGVNIQRRDITSG